MSESDLIVAWGASLGNHTGIAEYKPIIQVDFDPMMVGRFHSVDLPILGDVGATANLLASRLTDLELRCVDHRSEVADRWAIWSEEKERRELDDHGAGINAASLFESMPRLVPDDAVICVDVGNNAYSFGRYFEACGQDVMEFTTAVKYGMDITHVLMNNAELGKISKEQRAAEWDVWQTSLVNPSFSAFAQSRGGLGIVVTDLSDLDDAVSRALAHDGPALVEVMTDPLLV